MSAQTPPPNLPDELTVGAAATTVEKGHPRGLYVLFGTEMWERFGYYGMRALLLMYMMNGLAFAQKDASRWYGWYTGLVYATPILGGYIADRFLGYRKTILLGALIMMAGYFMLMVRDQNAFIAALGLLIIGNGMFKPNISTIVGKLYKPADPRRDAGFSIFYMGINVGAFITPYVCGTLGERYSPTDLLHEHPLADAFRWGFMAAGVGMLVGFLTFHFGRGRLAAVNIDEPEGAVAKRAAATASAVPEDRSKEMGRIIALLIFAVFTIVFWMGFEQAGNTLTLWCMNNTNREVLGFNVPVSWFQSVNAAFVWLLAPLFSVLWVALARRRAEPSTGMKMVLGLLFLGLGYVWMVMAAKSAGSDAGHVSFLWLIGVFLIHTVGELCLSPIGLSLVTKLAPARLGGMLMGVWFLAVFAGNKLGGNIGELWSTHTHQVFFEILVGTSVIPALLLLALLKPLKKLMAGAAE